MDYGRDYDRSSYIRKSRDDEGTEEEEEAVSRTEVESITVSAVDKSKSILRTKEAADEAKYKIQESTAARLSNSATTSMFDGLIGNKIDIEKGEWRWA